MRREFTGYDTDIESGLQYAGARYYDPSQARFLSMDPAGQFQSPYAYTGWDPVNMTDPTGTFGGWISAFIGFAAAGVMQLFRTILMGTEGSWGDFGRGVVNAHTKGATSDLIGLGGIGPAAGYAALQGASATEAARVGLGTKFSIAASAYALTQAKSKNQTALAGVGLAAAVGSVVFTLASHAQRKRAVEVRERGTLSEGGLEAGAGGNRPKQLTAEVVRELGTGNPQFTVPLEALNESEAWAVADAAANPTRARGEYGVSVHSTYATEGGTVWEARVTWAGPCGSSCEVSQPFNVGLPEGYGRFTRFSHSHPRGHSIRLGSNADKALYKEYGHMRIFSITGNQVHIRDSIANSRGGYFAR